MSSNQKNQNTKKYTNPKLDILLNSYQSLKLILSPNLSKKKVTFMNLLLELITSQLKLYVELLNTTDIKNIYNILNTNHQKLSEGITSLFSLSIHNEKDKDKNKEKEKDIFLSTPLKQEAEKGTALSPILKSESKHTSEISLNKSNQKETIEHNNSITSKVSDENKKITENDEKINKKEKIIEWGKVKEKEILNKQKKLFEKVHTISKSNSNKKMITRINSNPKFNFKSRDKMKQTKPKYENKTKKIEPKKTNPIKAEILINKTENLLKQKIKEIKKGRNKTKSGKLKSPERYKCISTCPPIYNVIGNNKIFTNQSSNDDINTFDDKYVSIRLTNRLMERLNNKKKNKNKNNNTENKKHFQNSYVIEEEDSKDVVNFSKKDKNLKDKNIKDKNTKIKKNIKDKNNNNKEHITLDEFLIPLNSNKNGEKLFMTKAGHGILTEKQKDLLENYLNNCLFDEEIESDIKFTYFPTVKNYKIIKKQNSKLTPSSSGGNLLNIKDGNLSRSLKKRKNSSNNEEEDLKESINFISNNLEGSLDSYLKKKKASLFDLSIVKICHDVIENYKKLEAKEEKSKSKNKHKIRAGRKKMTVNTIYGMNKLRELNNKLRLDKCKDDDDSEQFSKNVLHLSFS